MDGAPEGLNRQTINQGVPKTDQISNRHMPILLTRGPKVLDDSVHGAGEELVIGKQWKR